MVNTPYPPQRAPALARALFRNRLLRRRPLILMHAVTEACNARCPYCVFRHGKRAEAELSLPEIDTLYRDAAALGIRYVHLWGGEPLAHPRIAEIAQLARKHGLSTGMVTNGLLLPRRAEKVMPHLGRLFISLDHPTDRHDDFRQTPGLFEAATRGLRQVRQQWPKIPVVISYTLFRDNQDALLPMLELCKSWGARLYINPMRAAANAEGAAQDMDALEVDNNERIIPWEEQAPIWRDLIDLRRRGYPVQNSLYYMRKIARTGRPPSYRCHWPKLAMAIDANGDVVDCQRWDQPMANLRDAPLAEVWSSERARQLTGPCGERCNTCVSPARVEPSGIWGLQPAMLSDSIRSLVLNAR